MLSFAGDNHHVNSLVIRKQHECFFFFGIQKYLFDQSIYFETVTIAGIGHKIRTPCEVINCALGRLKKNFFF